VTCTTVSGSRSSRSTANCETCNVQIVDSVGAPIVLLGSDGGSGIAAYPFSGPIRYATARTLVKTEA
jgi:hypothetical protein